MSLVISICLYFFITLFSDLYMYCFFIYVCIAVFRVCLVSFIFDVCIAPFICFVRSLCIYVLLSLCVIMHLFSSFVCSFRYLDVSLSCSLYVFIYFVRYLCRYFFMSLGICCVVFIYLF